jgi:hypothetical protein
MAQKYHEGTLFERFKALAAPLVKREPGNDWEWYFLAQHHGLKTRLLDWTENLLTAIYFAVGDEIEAWGGASPTVWIMDAGTLNVATCGADKDSVFVLNSERLASYLPEPIEKDPTAANEKPIAILAARSNERIVAQQGCFTVHGHSMLSLDDLAEQADIRIARLVFDPATIGEVRRELETCGVHAFSLFPDLDHAARHILRTCQRGEGSLMCAYNPSDFVWRRQT